MAASSFEGRDLLTISERDMRKVRGRDIAMIFQEPMTSLNPVATIGDQIVEVLAPARKAVAQGGRASAPSNCSTW